MANNMFQGALPEAEVKSVVSSYSHQFEGRDDGSRSAHASELSRDYYDLVTDFYEYGWGQSFHFAPRHAGETVQESIVRYESYLALRLGLKTGLKALDVGCGVAGPMRNISRLSGADVTGISINQYQVDRGNLHIKKARLDDRCRSTLGDFLKMPFENETFDAAYTIEACCHAADRRGPFGETFRTLKKGGLFAGYEWCVTDKFDKNNPEHARIALGIEKGDGLPPMVPTSEIGKSLKDVGFEVLDTFDAALLSHPETPWYEPLRASMTLNGFRHTKTGAFLTHQAVRVLETLHVSPKGTVEAHDVLRLAQRALVEGGELGIFTPSYFFLARKP